MEQRSFHRRSIQSSGKFHRKTPRLELLEDRCCPSAVNFTTAPILPIIDAGMQAHLQAVEALGAALGNQPDVFAKVGDSNTWYPMFLNQIGLPGYDPTDPVFAGSRTDLAGTINYFRAEPVDAEGNNSFTHVSWASFGGWRTDDILNPNHNNDPSRSPPCLPWESPLASELRLTRPAFALIMVGTIDVAQIRNPDIYRFNLTWIANSALSQGVIPVLSTIPDIVGPNFSGIAPLIPVYNQVVAEVAASLNVPLWNFWRALQLLPNHGIRADGVHLSAAPEGGGVFTDSALDFGFNLRNLTAVEVLDKLRRIVEDGGQPDPPGGPPDSPDDLRFLQGIYNSLLGRTGSPGELDGWDQELQGGVPRLLVIQAIWRSPEHRGREVDQYFQSILHRFPSATERNGWINVFAGGANELNVEQALLLSAEYQFVHLNNGTFVTGLYSDLLGRPPDLGSSAAWVTQLQHGAPRATVVAAILNSAEEDRRVIDGDYQTYLHRAPDQPGEQAWLVQLETGTVTSEGIAEAFLDSSEYWAHLP